MHNLYVRVLNVSTASGVFEAFSSVCVDEMEAKLREEGGTVVHPWFELLFAHFSSGLMWLFRSPEVTHGLNHSRRAACSIPPLLAPWGHLQRTQIIWF